MKALVAIFASVMILAGAAMPAYASGVKVNGTFQLMNLTINYADGTVRTVKETLNIRYFPDSIFTDSTLQKEIKSIVISYDLYDNNLDFSVVLPQTVRPPPIELQWPGSRIAKPSSPITTDTDSNGYTIYHLYRAEWTAQELINIALQHKTSDGIYQMIFYPGYAIHAIYHGKAYDVKAETEHLAFTFRDDGLSVIKPIDVENGPGGNPDGDDGGDGGIICIVNNQDCPASPTGDGIIPNTYGNYMNYLGIVAVAGAIGGVYYAYKRTKKP